MSVKIIVHYGWNPSMCICENDKYLKSIADTSVITCDEVISVIDIVSTKMAKYYSKNVSIHPDRKKVRYKFDCYLFACSFIDDHITIDDYYCLLSLCNA